MNNSGSGGIGASGGRRTLGPRRPAGRLGAAGAKPSARRCLFGPVDHQETDDFLKEMNRQLDEQKKELWGFDFKTGRPVPGGHPVYEWVRVGANDDIPCAYGRLGESWRGPEIVSWSNEYTEIQGVEGADVSLNSYRLNEHSRKRLRRLSPDNPELDTALTSYCSSAGDCQNRGLDKAVTKHSSDCSNAGGSPVELEGVSRPGDELPLKDLRKSEEKLEKHSGSKPSDVPGCLEGSGLPSTVRAKDVDVPEDFPTMMNDDSIVALPNPRYDSVPENKMPTKIFVGRLAEGTSSDDLRALFRKFGTVTECDVITNYGFVHMETEAEASAAIAALDGYSVKGNHISVEMSTAKTQGRKRRTTDTFRGNGKGPSVRYDPYQPRRDTYSDASLARPAMDSRAMEREAYPQPREEYASEQVKDLLELYFRDRNAFDQYARTYYYGERSERAARSYYDAKVADDYPVASHRDDDVLARSGVYSDRQYELSRSRYSDIGNTYLSSRSGTNLTRDERSYGVGPSQSSYSFK